MKIEKTEVIQVTTKNQIRYVSLDELETEIDDKLGEFIDKLDLPWNYSKLNMHEFMKKSSKSLAELFEAYNQIEALKDSKVSK